MSTRSPSEQQDFREQMMWAAFEGAQLQEVARGSVDRLPRADVQHGPWQPTDCSAYLLRAFEAGLVAVLTDDDDDRRTLTDDDTRVLLAARSAGRTR